MIGRASLGPTPGGPSVAPYILGQLMRRPRLGPIVAAVLLILCAACAHATSCTPRDVRYVFSCDGQRCTGAFRVDEVAAFGSCSRRPLVQDIDPKLAEFLAPLVGPAKPGVYTITLPDQYWRAEADDGSLEALLDRLNDRAVEHGDRGRVDWRALNPTELRQAVEKRYGSEWLSQDTAHGTAPQARHGWESAAWRAQALAVSQWAAYWASFAAALVWLVHSIHAFFFRLYRAPAQGLRRFAAPWTAQLVIGAVGVGAAVLMPFEIWPGTLLVPVVVVVLLAEGWACFRRRRVA